MCLRASAQVFSRSHSAYVISSYFIKKPEHIYQQWYCLQHSTKTKPAHSKVGEHTILLLLSCTNYGFCQNNLATPTRVTIMMSVVLMRNIAMRWGLVIVVINTHTQASLPQSLACLCRARGSKHIETVNYQSALNLDPEP